jgi:hypothetical protein
VNDSALAVPIAVTGGNTYFDRRNTGTTYYYWIRIVSVHGTVGVLIGPAVATAAPIVEFLLAELTGRIDDGVLAPSLKSTLGEISTLNANLAQEVLDREGGQVSFGQALADVQNEVAEAHTFIANEIATRTTANSAMAEQIQLTAATLAGDIAAVTVQADAWIDPVNDIGARWTAQVTANGLVGGFGVYNDSSTVEAGFDVDTFWVGRTSADKRKPFVVDGDTGEVYIDNAIINQLTADRIDSRGLSIRNATGDIILSAGTPLAASHISGLAAEVEQTVIDTVNTVVAVYEMVIESSNGTIFRVGGGTTTTIKARVFKNGVEVTDTLPATAFRWTRVSMIPQNPPMDDYTWNMTHATGYKAFVLSVDDVYARASFFCEIIS